MTLDDREAHEESCRKWQERAADSFVKGELVEASLEYEVAAFLLRSLLEPPNPEWEAIVARHHIVG